MNATQRVAYNCDSSQALTRRSREKRESCLFDQQAERTPEAVALHVQGKDIAFYAAFCPDGHGLVVWSDYHLPFEVSDRRLVDAQGRKAGSCAHRALDEERCAAVGYGGAADQDLPGGG